MRSLTIWVIDFESNNFLVTPFSIYLSITGVWYCDLRVNYQKAISDINPWAIFEQPIRAKLLSTKIHRLVSI